MSKSAEEFQAEILRICTRDSAQLFDPANLLVRRNVTDRVIQVVGTDMEAEPAGSVREFDVGNLEGGGVEQYKRYYDYIFGKYFSLENFPDGKIKTKMDMMKLNKFREEEVSWIPVETSGDSVNVNFSDVKVPGNRRLKKPFIGFVPTDFCAHSAGEITLFGYMKEKNIDAYVCFLKMEPIDERWGAILLAGILEGLLHRIGNPNTRLAPPERQMETLKKTITQNVMAASISNGKFDRTVVDFINKYRISDMETLIICLNNAEFTAEVKKVLPDTITPGKTLSNAEKHLCMVLFMNTANLSFAQSKYENVSIAAREAIRGIAMLSEAGLI